MSKKPYGGRWEVINDRRLGSGGQGEVFRVRDISGRLEGAYALKRVPNIKRRDRFKREVEAIKRLTDPLTKTTHPNIISLIDHSALDESADGEKQFLVMPIAEGGDLSSPGRLALYKDSIDSVLQVARQLAQALAVAHKAGVIHRDVKPQNVLFTGNGHETWLSDFGICLIRDEVRITETPEVVGPRAFMAPELEDGGKLEVTPAADIYSLGKLVYYMISDGVILPREQWHETKYRSVLAKGQRHHLLEMLLSRMVCPLDRRLQSADELLKEFAKIEDWEANAQLLPVSADAVDAIRKLQQRSMEAARITEENEEARRHEQGSRARIQTSVTAWLEAELQKVASTAQSEAITCSVRPAALNGGVRMGTGHNSLYAALNGVELALRDVNDIGNREHLLQFFLCEHHRQVVTITSVNPGQKTRTPNATPARDGEFAVVPIYRQRLLHQPLGLAAALGYLSKPAMVGHARGRLQLPRPGNRNRQPKVANYRVEPVMPQFEPNVSLHADFRASEWPIKEDYVRVLIKAACDVFFTRVVL
jgi:serine/threonine protein kinase